MMSAIKWKTFFRVFCSMIICFAVSALPSIPRLASAQTWEASYHGPWVEWYTGTTFYGAIRTSDGGYLLTGTSNNRGVILKVAGNGTLQWTKLIQGNGYQRESSMIGAVETPNGDFIVTGQVNVGAPINPDATTPSWDIYIIRLTSTGGVSWEKIYARKSAGSVPDTQEIPHFIYHSVPVGNYVVTGYVEYAAVPGCTNSGYRSSQALVIDGNGVVQNDFLMAGPTGTVKTYYTGDGNYLVLTEQFYNSTLLYTTGVQKYGSTGALLWSKAYHEAYQSPNGEEYLKISAGVIDETPDGYVVFGNTYYNIAPAPPLTAYYHFKVDKATGSVVAWNRKFRAWPDNWSIYVLNSATTTDGGLVTTIGDGVTTANDRVFKTKQNNGDLLWLNEYGAFLGTVTPGVSELAVTANAFDGVLARLTSDGHMAASCTSIPVADKTGETTEHPILRTDVRDSYSQSDCNSYIGKVASYNVALTEVGEYHQVSRCGSGSDTVTPQLLLLSN